MGSHASRRGAGRPDDAARILDALRRIVRHLRLVAGQSESRVGVAPAQLFVLSRLRDQPASSVRELAARTLTDPSSVSVVLSKLEARGLISRSAHPTDKRRAQFALTARGRAALERAPELPQVRLVAAIGKLSATYRRTVADALVEVAGALGASGVKPELFFEDGSATPAAARKRAAPSKRKPKRKQVRRAR
jgi:DNA-binding MarR family transcriptional regulator